MNLASVTIVKYNVGVELVTRQISRSCQIPSKIGIPNI